jgi:adenylosuccinate lyase
VERVIFPDAAIVLDFMVHEVTDLLDRLAIYPDKMRANLDLTRGLIYSQPVLLALVEAGMDRQEAHKLIQGYAHSALKGGLDLETALAQDERITRLITADSLAELFDPMRQLNHVDDIFRRLGLTGGEESGRSQHDISL